MANVISPILRFNFGSGYPEFLSQGQSQPVAGPVLRGVLDQYHIEPLCEIKSGRGSDYDSLDVPCLKPYRAEVSQEYYDGREVGNHKFVLSRTTDEHHGNKGWFGQPTRTDSIYINQKATPVRGGERLEWRAVVPTHIFRQFAGAAGLIEPHQESIWGQMQNFLSTLAFGFPRTKLNGTELLELAHKLDASVTESGDIEQPAEIKKITTRFSNNPQLRRNFWESMLFTFGTHPSIGNGEITTSPEEPGKTLGYKVAIKSPEQGASFHFDMRPDRTIIQVSIPGSDGKMGMMESAWMLGMKQLFKSLAG